MSMKIVLGNSRPTSWTKSHSPLSTMPSRISENRLRTFGSSAATAAGENSGPSSCRQAVWMWPSSISGIQRYCGSGSDGTTALFENTWWFWNEARMSAMRVISE